MIKTLLLLSLITISTSCFSQVQNERFEIVGNVSGFRDSARIDLYDFSSGSNDMLMDSARILDGKFVFKGIIHKNYQSVGLICQRNIRVFWIESGVIHFTAEKGKFQDAVITGSPMQEEDDRLRFLESQNPQNEKAVDIDYIKTHPNSLIGADRLGIYCTTWGKDTSKLLYDGLSEKVKQSEFGKKVYEYILLNKDIKVGDQFADFTLPDINGKEVSLSSYKNKYVLLDFWGSWCGPCRQENPNLVKTYYEFKDKGFDILGVSIETDKKWWLDAMRKDSIAWESVSDLKGQANQAALIYGIHYYPANFLIDPKGTIIAKDLRGEKLREKLKELFE